MPMASICLRTPSRSNSAMFAGSSDSPMWKRGWRAFSSSTTSRPWRASSAAMVEPAGPPPTTSTSQQSGSDGVVVDVLMDAEAIITKLPA